MLKKCKIDPQVFDRIHFYSVLSLSSEARGGSIFLKFLPDNLASTYMQSFLHIETVSDFRRFLGA
jgi:hypothetical protein